MFTKLGIYKIDVTTIVVYHDNKDAIKTSKEAYSTLGHELMGYIAQRIYNGSFDNLDINNDHSTITTTEYNIIDNTTTTETITIRRS